MENATKALIIAASVLIVLLIIATGIKILNSTSGVTEEVETSATSMEVSMFNSKFENYKGSQTAKQVRDLFLRVTTNNDKQSSDKRVSFTYKTKNGTATKLDAADTTNYDATVVAIYQKILNAKKDLFKVSMSYNWTTGRIVNIVVQNLDN